MWRAVAGPGMAVSEPLRARGYSLRCLPSQPALVAEMMLENTTCDLGLGSVTVTEARVQAGFRFSYPYFLTALGVLVKSEPEAVSGFGWTRPFSWQLWAALGATLLLFPLVLALIEFGSLKTRLRASELAPGYYEAIVRSMWTITGGETLEVSSAGAKFASVCFAFCALIITATYTANLASVLTISSLSSSITSVDDLRGRAVLTDSIYAPRLLDHHGLVGAQAAIKGQAALAAAARQVLDGSLAAVVHDHAYLLRASEEVAGCALRVLPWKLESFNYAVVASLTLAQSVLDEVNRALLELEEGNELEELRVRFRVLEDPCGAEGATSQAVALSSLAGLWAVMLGGAAVGAVVMLAARLRRRRAAGAEDDPWSVITDGGIGRAHEGVAQPDLVAATEVVSESGGGGAVVRRWRSRLNRVFTRSKSSSLESSTALSGHELGFKDRLDTIERA
jgi:ABC-type amino acid transport substrate-binding protein